MDYRSARRGRSTEALRSRSVTGLSNFHCAVSLAPATGMIDCRCSDRGGNADVSADPNGTRLQGHDARVARGAAVTCWCGRCGPSCST
jgi:hypothetical protein